MTAPAGELAALPATRADAKAIGATHYFTGKPCPQGHVAARRFHNGECLECGRASCRERASLVPKDVKHEQQAAYLERNREEINARRRDRHALDPRKCKTSRAIEYLAEWNAGKGKEYKSQWCKDNRERLNEKNRAWKREHDEQVRHAKAEYYQRNPHIGVLEGHRRRARKRNAEGFFTKADLDAITAAQNGLCNGCKKKRKLTVDHILALANGGSNWPANIQMLCQTCNCKKHTIDNETFMQLMRAA